MFQKFIGDKAFYRRTMAIALPIIIQNGISNFVSLLDNIMVGQVGTLEMSGVSVVNQLLFVFYLCLFGATSGAGIFTAQYHGSDDQDGIRHTFRFKFLICTVIAVVGIGIFLLGGEGLINSYLQGEGNAEDAASTLLHGMDYLKMMLLGLPPFALSNVYASTLRECGQTKVPMVASVTAVFVNLALNYVLIFGHLGMPAMGVSGAALATVISRYVELLIVAFWTHLHPAQNPYIRKAYRSLYIPGKLFGNILTKGTPLLLNEFMWSAGMATLNQCYSTCSLEVVPAMNICSTLHNLACVVFLAIGSTVGIIMGQMLGANRPEAEIRAENRKLLTLGVFSGVVFGVCMAAFSGVFPLLYNTEESVRQLSTGLILICAAAMPLGAYLNPVYFTLRSGGKTMITFLFDSGFLWLVTVPLAFCLSRFTELHILPLFALCQVVDIIKCILGAILNKRGTWIQRLS